MKITKNKIVVILLAGLILGSSIYLVSDIWAEQIELSPESGATSRIKVLSDDLTTLGYGSISSGSWGDWGSIWNRIYSASTWVPDGTVTEDTVVSGYTFYDESRTEKTGTLDYPNYEAQSLQAKDFRDSNASASWSPWTKTNSSPEVWYDARTGLYWSASQGSMTNEFTIGLCDFFTTTPRGNYDGSDVDCGTAINTCGTLSVDANGDTVTDSNWYLPTQAELMQAYLNGIYVSTSTSWVTTSLFCSSTEMYTNSSYAWPIYLFNGNTDVKTKSSSFSVRCVLRDL